MCPRPTFYLYKGLKITAFIDSIFAIVILQYSNIVHFTSQLHLVKVVRVTIKEKMVNDIFSDHNSATKTCFVCKVCSQEHLLAFEKKVQLQLLWDWTPICYKDVFDVCFSLTHNYHNTETDLKKILFLYNLSSCRIIWFEKAVGTETWGYADS